MLKIMTILMLVCCSYVGCATSMLSEKEAEELVQRERKKWKYQAPKPQKEKDNASSNRFFRYAATNIPHRNKLSKGGEDAYYVSDSLMTIADGVGGWINRGIDSGLYSKKLVW